MPTITTTLNPGTYSPARGAIWYVLDSTSSGITNFEYILSTKKVDLITGCFSSIGTFSVTPAAVNLPNPGTGRYAVNEVLNSHLTYNITPFITSIVAASQSLVKYFNNYGFSYNPNARFVNIVLNVGTTIGFNNITSGGPFDFAVGDIVNVVLDEDSTNPQYNGLATITYVQNPLGFQYISIDKAYVSPGAGPGYITNLKRPLNGTSSTLYAYNGTRQYHQGTFSFTNGSGQTGSNSYDWTLDGPGYVFYPNLRATSALTNYKDGFTVSNFPPTATEFRDRTKKVFLDNYETLSLIMDDFGAFVFTFNTYDINRAVIGTFSSAFGSVAPSFLYKRYDMPVGPKNLKNAGWITNWTNVKYYTLKIHWVTGDEPPFTIWNKYMKYYEVDTSCPTRFTNYRLAFVNLHGGIDYWNFNYKSKSKLRVDRNEYTRALNYNYAIGARQDSIYSVISNYSYNVTSDFLTPYDHRFLGELIRTTEAYLVDEVNQQYYPIIVTTPDLDEDYDTNDQLRIVELDFRLAYDGNNQTG